jgi:hypothetical protein
MTAKQLLSTMSVGTLLLCGGMSISHAQSPGDTPAAPGRVYLLHTPAGGGCPVLNWHVVVGEQNSLSGLIDLDEKTVFHVTGSYDGKAKTFELSGTEIGGTRTATLSGHVDQKGRLATELKGLPVSPECQAKTVYVQWITPKTSETSN